MSLDVNKLTGGYTTIPIDFPELRNECIKAATAYFNQSIEEKSQSYTFPVNEERGYRLLERKESFLIRDAKLPPKLKCFEKVAPRMHDLCLKVLQKIEQHLQLKNKTLTGLTHPTVWNDQKDRINESVFRVFRYFPTPLNTKELPCEAHDDLGLITIAFRSTLPSLEVLNLKEFKWDNVETTMKDNEVIVLIGESLSSLTRRYFPSCTHQVAKNVKERYSFVYQLRLRDDAMIDSNDFRSPKYSTARIEHFQKTGKEFFSAIRANKHSVNGTY